ncbi:peptidyl-tRNA hydrolase Pth2 [Methanocalculus sp.]|uniref:peptidyl-tRNA hydrolase Pth2 n=2 Tax=Methanocalculus sp. TaxID=2004547 RepID=UPI00271A923F|nr:peptidyl-tRNA hydrolase Pth2 [Methanocalculus sp.]MDO8841825.1 peptidyl-tRNA hydrolase Pth2 [Methanocalculus sp.]
MRDPPEFAWKQCLIIRDDVKMSCGKKCAQIAHAAIGAYEKASAASKRSWLDEGQKKVTLKVSGERALFELKVIAEANGIPACIIQDAGLTEIPPGTVTALGLGPAKSELLDRITSDLKLL